MNKFFKDISKNPTTIILIVAVILLISTWSKIIKYFSHFFGPPVKPDEVGDVIEEEELAECEVSYSDNQFRLYVDTLVTAMGGSWDMTNHEAIKGVMLKMNNDCDVNQLIKIFDTREYDYFGQNSFLTLPQWFNEEMETIDVWKYVNGPLIKNNVNYRF
jgi:hypothetical protein